MVEHRTPNPGVGGSNPSWPATLFIGEAHRLRPGNAMIICNDIMYGVLAALGA